MSLKHGECKLSAFGIANLLALAVSICGFLSLSKATVSADPVDWPTLGFTQAVANTFIHPVVITHAGDNSQRLFVVEQPGRIWIVQSNGVLAQPFLDISSRVLSDGAEQGLLGLVFSPGFSTNNYFYVDYTRQTDGAIVISRFFLTSTNSNIADTNSEQIIKVISKPSPPTTYNNHNAGQLAFGPDGYLYIGVGDGGSEGDPLNNGQKTNLLFGKILRVDVESGISPYAIPPNNPFVNSNGHAPETWAWGFRNPWRFSFDRQTGDLYIGDVGQNLYEEIDFQPAGSAGGQNYGWRIMEGDTNYSAPSGFTNFSALTLPVAVYSHLALPTDSGGAVIGGYVYRGPSMPRMDGIYFYGDFMAGWIWGLKQIGTNWQNLALLSPGFETHIAISTFGEDDQGRLYLADYFRGLIYQIQDSLQVWTPTFSPTNGIVTSNTVIVSCVTTGAVIHYTSNGIDPTASDPVVTSGGTIQAVTGITNKLRAFRADLTPSAVATAIFTKTVGTPVFFPPAGPIPVNTSVSISTVTPNAVIYYTTDSTTPTTNSLVYSVPLTLSGGATVKALGVATGFSNSVVASASYSSAQTATPIFTPSIGPITNGTSISISCPTPGSVIYYTTNSSSPTTNSTIYSGPIIINGGTTVKAFATANGYTDGSVNSTYFQLVQTQTPTFSPASGPFTNGTSFTISCGTLGAAIFYTLDGTNPTTNSPVYSAPIATNRGFTLKAFAIASQHVDSVVQSVFFGLSDYKYATVVTTVAGNGQSGDSNGVGAAASFDSPAGICLDPSGNIYVADFFNNQIRKITPTGNVSTFASNGLSLPTGICSDPGENIYAADAGNARIVKINSAGNVVTFADNGILYFPTFIECDAQTNLYVGDAPVVLKITPDGTVTTLARTNPNRLTIQSDILGLCVNISNYVYAANAGGLIFEISPAGMTNLFAGSSVGYNDGPRLNALFSADYYSYVGRDTAIDSFGNIYVSDVTWVRKIDTNGWVSTLAGSPLQGFINGDGRSARFSDVTGLCVDTNGNIYVADSGNNCIRKISPDTTGIGIADDWQFAHFGHIGIDPNADPDHDGMSNYEEFWAGTDPNDSNSVLAIDRSTLIFNGYVQIRWQTVSGKTYAVQYSTDLVSWSDLRDPVQGDGSIATVNDTSRIQQEGQKYYRIVIVGF